MTFSETALVFTLSGITATFVAAHTTPGGYRAGATLACPRCDGHEWSLVHDGAPASGSWLLGCTCCRYSLIVRRRT